MPQAKSSRDVIAGPQVQFATIFWGVILAVFGAVLIVSSVREKKMLYAFGGGALIVASIPVFLLRSQTLVDPAAGLWIRKSGILGMNAKNGALAEIAQLSVRQGLDSKGHKYWAVNLLDQSGEEVPWHVYTYLGERGMKQDVARLESALGMKASWTTDEE